MTDLAPILPYAAELIALFAERKMRIATAESCTGGLIAATLTEIPGSSAVFERGFVTYSNQAKTDLLGVPADLIDKVGSVSEEVARAMAEGAMAHSLADVTVSVTGIAGPDGGTPEKPVGLVHIAVASRRQPTRHLQHRFHDSGRSLIRISTVEKALEMLYGMVS